MMIPDVRHIVEIGIEQAKHSAQGNQFLSGGLVLGMIGGFIASVRKIPSRIWLYLNHKFTVTLEVNSNDEIFRWLLLWLSKHPYVKRSRNLTLKHIKGEPVFIPAKGFHFFFWQKRPVWMTWGTETAGQKGSSGGVASASPATGKDDFMNMFMPEKITLTILGRSHKIMYKLVEEALDLGKEDTKDMTKIYHWKYGFSSDYKRKRPFSSVFLPKNVKGIVEDARKFFASQSEYVKLNIPFRRGYLFYGPPGTGKSTTALALASELELPLYVVNLATAASDSSIENIFLQIGNEEPKVVLFEDIDTAIPQHRDVHKDTDLFSLGTFLNAIDGVIARENIIIILTTNHKESLDAALLRPGRVDKQYEFGLASKEQILEAIALYNPPCREQVEPRLLAKAGKVSMADIQEELRGLVLL